MVAEQAGQRAEQAVAEQAAELEAPQRQRARLTIAGAARNALDAALWACEAREAGRPVWQLAGLPPPTPVTTAFTLSLGDPASMAAAAQRAEAAK